MKKIRVVVAEDQAIILGALAALLDMENDIEVVACAVNGREALKAVASDAVSGARPDLLDRNGQMMATDIKTMSVFAEPRRIAS